MNLISEKDAAKRLGVSALTLHRRRKEGKIGFHRIGSRVLYSEAHLESYLSATERPAATKKAANAW